MTLLAAIDSDVLQRAGVAYVHYLSFMLCFGALVLERRLIRPNPSKQEDRKSTRLNSSHT